MSDPLDKLFETNPELAAEIERVHDEAGTYDADWNVSLAAGTLLLRLRKDRDDYAEKLALASMRCIDYQKFEDREGGRFFQRVIAEAKRRIAEGGGA